MTSPFDTLTGVHMVEIDTSDNTDAGFWAAGNLYHVMLAPDETVDGQTLTGVHLASFGIVYGAAAKQNTNIALILSRIGTPSNLGSGATVAGNLVDLEAQTDDIGAAGAGLTAVPWNAAWDAEVQSEAADAITAAALATAANLATLAGYVDTEVAAILAAVDTEVAAIKTKTDYLPSATAGAAGGLFIAGANAATSITTALTANITGNLSGSVGSVTGAVGSVTGAVGSVTGAVGSVTGNVGGNVVGSVGSVSGDTKQTADVAALITTVGVAGAGLTALATQASVNTIDDFLDTEIAAILADTNELQTDLVNGGRLDLLIDAIKAKTDNLPSDPADQSAVEAAITAATSPLATAAALATVDGIVDDILVDTGTTLPASLTTIDDYLDTEVAAIKAVADKLDTALVLDGAVYQFTANALELAPTGGSAPSAADIRAEIDSNSTQLAAIVADTNELQGNQGDWATADVSGLALEASLDEIKGTGWVDQDLLAIWNQNDDMLGAIGFILDRLGAWTGTGVNTLLGAFKALLSKDASAPSDIGGTFSPATDSTEAISEAVAGVGAGGGLTAQETRDAMQLAATDPGDTAAGSVDAKLDGLGTSLASATITVVSAIVGSTITITRGDTFSAAITGMGSIASYANVWFTIKRATSDADSEAIVQIDTDTGLLTVNGASATAGDGSITVDDANAGDITIALAATVTDDLTPATGLVYDVQWQTAAGAIHTLTSGAAVVAADVTRAVS